MNEENRVIFRGLLLKKKIYIRLPRRVYKEFWNKFAIWGEKYGSPLYSRTFTNIPDPLSKRTIALRFPWFREIAPYIVAPGISNDIEDGEKLPLFLSFSLVAIARGIPWLSCTEIFIDIMDPRNISLFVCVCANIYI